jgi:hypothetical protein
MTSHTAADGTRFHARQASRPVSARIPELPGPFLVLPNVRLALGSATAPSNDSWGVKNGPTMDDNQAVIVSYARPATELEQVQIASFLAELPWKCIATQSHVVGPDCLLGREHLETRDRMKRHIDQIQHSNSHADVSEARRHP